MIQVDLPAAFAIGQVYAFLCKDYLKKEPKKFTNRIMGPFNLFMSCCFAPVGMFLLIGWPAWEVMYRTEWVEQPFDKPLVAAFYIFFSILMIALGNTGFILAHHWYRKGHDRRVIAGIITGLILTILPFILRWGIWMKVGTYDMIVNKGEGYSLLKPPFFIGWLVIMSYMALSIIIMALWLMKKGNKLEP